MKLIGLLAAALAVQAPPTGAPTAVDQMTVSQIMRLGTLPQARLQELRCAAFAGWLNKNDPSNSFALPPKEAERFTAAVAAAMANDLEMPVELAAQFIADLEIEPREAVAAVPESRRQDVIDERAWPCNQLFGDAREGKPLKLHPLARPSIVDPALASCYGLYRAATARSNGKEAELLAEDADKAAELALKDKQGDDRAAAEAVLASEAEAALKAPSHDAEAQMFRLVACLPQLQGLGTKPLGKL